MNNWVATAISIGLISEQNDQIYYTIINTIKLRRSDLLS